MAFDVRRFDIYRKIPKDLTQPTLTGAVISVCCCCFILLLFISEFLHFINVNVSSELFVDNPGDNDRILVHLNISLPRLSCSVLGLDIQDEMGRHEVGFVENILKQPLGEKQEGCLFEGRFYINKVPGNFHVSTHSASTQPDSIDMAHIIHEVSFGTRMGNSPIKGSFNPLKGIDRSKARDIESHDYVMKIVPTIYETLDGLKIETYQYTYAYKSSVTFSHSGRIMPAIWFRYDLTPITVKYTESRPPLYSFLTTVCAIVGGTFTVAGIIDSMVFSASEVFKKFEIGKLS
ncbi:endoplasmic reticulum-Golgi intermediate compartment protein 1-like isoform X2 [Argiope bruennichi]|uniref:Endoplasmic reticulum-Golgi intermediate like protein n=1 Tax=Argiope bruennichi TaxID=94029 RepID=A0A8T0E7D3_ARGBR|nr:endoplasmic reticulum-Golgi intermediate compartment protein 1-like isoform X2 [Argiope bruennichi]KAF8767404.1 Endoplasmic reticulum-Golgi intermediate like protein [Argiope bruennichi]